MTPEWQNALICLLASLGSMVALWLVSLKLRDVSIVDPYWGTGFVLVSWLAFALSQTTSTRMLLLCSLVTIWGLRLSAYLLWRKMHHGEDHRYVSMREHHGKRFWWVSLVTVFLLQGLILWLISLPVLLSANGAPSSPWSLLDGLGVLLWSVGIYFEAVGDWQLARFKAEPSNRGRVMNQGLWRYTRHPNYFGDFCVWWGIYLIAVGNGVWWTIFSPLLMTMLLMRISGVSLLESTIEERRPEYAAYKASTSPFFPWPPVKNAV